MKKKKKIEKKFSRVSYFCRNWGGFCPMDFQLESTWQYPLKEIKKKETSPLLFKAVSYWVDAVVFILRSATVLSTTRTCGPWGFNFQWNVILIDKILFQTCTPTLYWICGKLFRLCFLWKWFWWFTIIIEKCFLQL